MNREKIDSNTWNALGNQCRFASAWIMKSHSLPSDYNISFDELLSEAYWQAMYLVNNYRPGNMTLLGYVSQWLTIRILNAVWAEYNKLEHISLEQLYDELDNAGSPEKYIEKHVVGEGTVHSMVVDNSEAQETHDIMNSIYDKLSGKDKTIASMYMKGYTLEEIGDVFGLNKATILKRIRKMKNGVKL